MKHCITFVHPSSTLRPHAITSGLFPIPCLTLVYRTGVTQSNTLLLSIFRSPSPRLTSNIRLSPLTWARAYKRTRTHSHKHWLHEYTNVLLQTHEDKCTHGWLACGGFHVSRSLPFIIVAALVIPTELCPPVLLATHRHISERVYGGAKGGRRECHWECLCQLPADGTFGIGKVWFDGFPC